MTPSTHRNGHGNFVIRDLADDRYIGREPDGDTSPLLCWPNKLNRHVMHFETRAKAQEYIDKGGVGYAPNAMWRVRRVRRKRR